VHGDAPDAGWRPTASAEALRLRAELLARLRGYFDAAGVLEVETPLLASGGVTDPNIPSFSLEHRGTTHYLNTSPEFAMKRLLAAGSGPIYQVCKAFRAGEEGSLHNPEFTLLEWYRPGFDHHRLMDEVAELVTALAVGLREFGPVERLTYGECFQRFLDIDAHRATASELKACAEQQGLGALPALAADDRDGWLDLLMSLCVQPRLGQGCLSFVYDYPASQAALARIRPGAPEVAERFELFIDGVELANGFHELQDAAQQRARFEADLEHRQAEGLEEVMVDEYLLAALESGLPDCAGVALGLDRLLLVLMRAQRLDEVLTFPFDRT
jgi:lysyl-tRNA synthetase class 2